MRTIMENEELELEKEDEDDYIEGETGEEYLRRHGFGEVIEQFHKDPSKVKRDEDDLGNFGPTELGE